MNPVNHDLRAWMGEVESINQLHRIQGVPWDKDMGGLVEMILERSKHSPALLFEKIPNAREDMQILCSQIDGIERLALAMGNDSKLGVTDFIQAWRRKGRTFEPVEPEYVKDGPILQNERIRVRRRRAERADTIGARTLYRSADSGLFGNRHRRRNGPRRQSAGRSVRRMARLLCQRHETGTGGARQSALLSQQSYPVR